MKQPLYLARTGMVNAIGANTEMCLASINAGINGYTESEFEDKDRQPVMMARVPDQVFIQSEVLIDKGLYYSGLYDRIIKMSIMAASEAFGAFADKKNVPMVIALPEARPGVDNVLKEKLIGNLINQPNLPLDPELYRCVDRGRAGGIQALEFAERVLYDLGHDYVLVGGSDSHLQQPVVSHLDQYDRLLTPKAKNGFAPGEGATFMLLTRHPHYAIKQQGQCIAFFSPSTAKEPGHWASEQPYRGEGLSEAVKPLLTHIGDKQISAVYSSMNGENYWAKEFGVMMLRHRAHFSDDVRHEHPADCYGDLGAATGPTLMAAAAYDLLSHQQDHHYLIYASSDGAWRSAALIQKLTAVQ